jgi:hypothetical protein
MTRKEGDAKLRELPDPWSLWKQSRGKTSPTLGVGGAVPGAPQLPTGGKTSLGGGEEWTIDANGNAVRVR